MPRKQRIEYPGAMYHIISRGNYRKELFQDRETGLAFEKTLFETAKRCGWKLYAYVIMSNHYHLALQTPEPNLVAGMKWLQSTFATRFNRFHNERGHVFQGRYKSLLIKEDRPLIGLIDYIHLNPVRAKLCNIDALKAYELSSFPKYFKRSVQPPLDRTSLLSLCDLPDTLSGMRQYSTHLEFQEERDPQKQDELSKLYCAADIGLWGKASITIREAMGCQLPLVLLDEPNMQDLIKWDNGVFVKPDADAISRSLAELLLDPSKRKIMGERGRKGVEDELSVEAEAKDLLKIYE